MSPVRTLNVYCSHQLVLIRTNLVQNGDSLIRIESPLHIDYENVSNARIQSTQVVYRDVDTYMESRLCFGWLQHVCY